MGRSSPRPNRSEAWVVGLKIGPESETKHNFARATVDRGRVIPIIA